MRAGLRPHTGVGLHPVVGDGGEAGPAPVASDQYPGALLADGVAVATSVRNTITATAHATPHTAGSWVEVDASLSAAASGIAVSPTVATNASGADSSTLLEIGTGAGGAEVVWATVGIGYRLINSALFVIPGAIAAGTRVAVRVRGAVTLQAVTAICQFLPVKTSVALGAPVTYQANTATSRGLTITAPGSLNTKGAWTELVASSASALSALGVFPQAGGGTNMNAAGVLVDIGVGAAAAEAVVISDIHLAAHAGEAYEIRSPLTYGVDIPAGSRISARYQRAATGIPLDLILVGAPPT